MWNSILGSAPTNDLGRCGLLSTCGSLLYPFAVYLMAAAVWIAESGFWSLWVLGTSMDRQGSHNIGVEH